LSTPFFCYPHPSCQRQTFIAQFMLRNFYFFPFFMGFRDDEWLSYTLRLHSSVYMAANKESHLNRKIDLLKGAWHTTAVNSKLKRHLRLACNNGKVAKSLQESEKFIRNHLIVNFMESLHYDLAILIDNFRRKAQSSTSLGVPNNSQLTFYSQLIFNFTSKRSKINVKSVFRMIEKTFNWHTIIQ
jgi:hypothetical protein